MTDTVPLTYFTDGSGPVARWVRNGRSVRRGLPILGVVGPNGSGKTAAAVFNLLPSLDMGRSVLSTVRLLDFRNPRPCDDDSCTSPNHDRHMAAHPNYVPWTEWAQLRDAEHCDVFADEITGVASSRDYSALPSPIVNKLMQLRRADCTFTWTAPAWARADTVLREVSQAATVCKGYFPVSDRSGNDRVWKNRRLFKWVTYDAAYLSDFEAGKREKLPKLNFSLFWGPNSCVFNAYDTFDSVSFINSVSDSGRCMDCSGRKRPVPCSCHK